VSDCYARLGLGLELETFTIAITCTVEVSMAEYGVHYGLEVLLTFVDLLECSGNVALNHDG
jgi:hypothetical protein